MVFSSPIFLFFFLPFFLIVYYVIPAKLKIGWIVLASWFFYALWRVDFLFLLILVSLLNYIFSRIMGNVKVNFGQKNTAASPAVRKLAVSLTVVANLLILGYFKYADFGIESLNMLIAYFGGQPLPILHVILPVGISFYIFQAMSYSIDVYRGHAEPAASFAELGAYIALFPQLIAGPIVRYKDVSDQLKEPHVSIGRTSRGIQRFMYGFAKKVLLADSLSGLVESSFSLTSPSFVDSWTGAIAYSMQLYLDFAAYSDMAIGLGLMLGLRFRENFRQPYYALSITEFWRRWHISLSNWLRDYLYIPLGGNRKGPARTYVNLFLVMLLGGLWHGANWTFVFWGAWHGLLLLSERLVKSRYNQLKFFGPSEMLNGAKFSLRTLARLKTLLFVVIAWVFFRAADLGSAVRYILAMAGTSGFALSPEFAWQIRGGSLLAFGAGLLFCLFESRVEVLARIAVQGRGLFISTARESVLRVLPEKISVILIFLFFIAAIVKLLADSYSPFLYFQF